MSEENKCVFCDEIRFGSARFCEQHLLEWGNNNFYSSEETDIYVNDYKNRTLRKPDEQPGTDMVAHPPHYTSHPSGIECIDVVRHMNYCLGNAIKYIWRAGLKGDKIEDLKKAKQYIDFEIERIENEK